MIKLIVLLCLTVSVLGVRKVVFKDDPELFGVKNNILFYKMLFGEKGMELMLNEMTDEERLMFDLLKFYNKHINPPTTTTQLKFSLNYLCANINPITHMMTSRLVENYMWQDMRLKWTPGDYNNIRQIRFPAKKIWTPDVKLFNSHLEEEMRDDVNVIIKNDGTVIYAVQVTYKTHCSPIGDTFMGSGINTGAGFNMDTDTDWSTEWGTGSGINRGINIGSDKRITTGIFKKFKCKIVVGSWSYDNQILKLVSDGLGLDKSTTLETCKHDISDLEVKIIDHTYPGTPGKYPAMHVDFTVTKTDI